MCVSVDDNRAAEEWCAYPLMLQLNKRTCIVSFSDCRLRVVNSENLSTYYLFWLESEFKKQTKL